MSIVGSNALAGASGQSTGGGGGGASSYQITKSVRLNSADLAHFSRTTTSASNRKTWTYSLWAKLQPATIGGYNLLWSATPSGSSGDQDALYIDSSTDQMIFMMNITDPGGSNFTVFQTQRRFRDPSAWQHIVLRYDSAASSNYAKLWINGVEETAFSTDNRNSSTLSNHDAAWNSVGPHRIGQAHSNNDRFNGYLAEIHFVDGTALAASDFGEFDSNNVWRPKDCKNNLTYGTNGFYLNFSDASSASALGLDQRPGATQNPTGTTYGLITGGSVANVFDGVASYTSELSLRPNGSGVTLDTAVTATSSVRIYGSSERTSVARYQINGSNTSAVPETYPTRGWTSISGLSFPITITSFGVGGAQSNDGARLSAIEIDGTVLTGTANNWTVNNMKASGLEWASTTWSNDISIDSGNFYLSGNNGPKGFDGNTSTNIDCRLGTGSNNTTNIIWEPTGGISGVTKIRVYSNFADDYRINNGSWTSFTSNGSWTQIYSGGAFTLTKLEIRRTTNSGSDYGHNVAAYELNDLVVLDNTAQVANDPDIDSLIDTPTNYTAASGSNNGGNYATLNVLAKTGTTTLSNGNLDFSGSTSGDAAPSTIGVSSGKWYFEATVTTQGNGQVGIVAGQQESGSWVGRTSNSWSFHIGNGNKYNNNTGVSYSSGTSLGDIVGCALDLDSATTTLTFYKNGSSLGTAYSNMSGEVFFFAVSRSSISAAFAVNFGQRPFAYTPPSDHLPLVTTNLSDPLIEDPSTAFDAVTYTGNGSSKTISGVGFSSDLIWTKCRNQARSHYLMDTVRGISKYLISEQTSAEGTNTTNRILSVTSDGWTLGLNNAFNGNNDTYVAWAWDAGSSNTTISAGSLNSTAYNQSAVWSGMCSPTPSINSFTNGFDGSLTTTFAGGISAGSYFTFTPTGGGITFTDKVRVYNGNVSGASYQYNGNSAQTFTANAWNTVATGGGTMTSFAVTRSGTDVHGWYAIEVDGLILVDQGATPAVNVPAVDSTCRTNQTAGFSIVSWTASGTNNDSVGHGLNAKPEFFILKSRDGARNWLAYTEQIDGSLDFLNLNSTAAKSNSSATAPTSSVFYVYGSDVNTSGEDMIAYCFAPVEGYSAFGTYTGSGSSSTAPFVYTGFKVAWLMVKGTSTSGGNWMIYDNARGSYNLNNAKLAANLSGQENESSTMGGTSLGMDFLSNGFKYTGDGGGNHNASGVTYLYAAFAEHPLSLNGGLAR